jgi:hypothetical protein
MSVTTGWSAFFLRVSRSPVSLLDATGVLGVAIIRVERGLIGAMCITHDAAKIQAQIVRDLSPALSALAHRHDFIKTPARCVGQKVGILQFTIAEASRGSLRFQRCHRHAGFIGNPIQVMIGFGENRQNARREQAQSGTNKSKRLHIIESSRDGSTVPRGEARDAERFMKSRSWRCRGRWRSRRPPDAALRCRRAMCNRPEARSVPSRKYCHPLSRALSPI